MQNKNTNFKREKRKQKNFLYRNKVHFRGAQFKYETLYEKWIVIWESSFYVKEKRKKIGGNCISLALNMEHLGFSMSLNVI